MLRVCAALVLNALLATGLAEALLHLLAASGPAGPAVTAPSSLLGGLALLPPALCLGLLLLTSGLPGGRLALASLLNLWAACSAAPLFLWLPQSVSIHWLWGAMQLSGVLLLLDWMLRSGGRPWVLSTDLAGLRVRPRRRLVLLGATTALALPLLAGAYAVAALLAWLQLVTGGFVSFDLVGVDLDDRRYLRADHEVRLVGMMHVGERERYRELVRSFVREDTVVLFEGVTDDQSLLGTGLDYGAAATALGLEAQHDLESYLEEIDGDEPAGAPPREWPVLQHADVDVADFAPQTRAFIERAAEVWRADSLLAALPGYVSWVREHDGGTLLALLEEDLIAARNAHLLGRLFEALEDFDRAVVPWGALHLPGIERALLDAGFREADRAERRLIRWSTLLGAL